VVRKAGTFRTPKAADRLLGMMEKNSKWRKSCYDAIVTISGYDQDIDDPEDEQTNRDWEKKQHPRHDAILARLMERLFAAGDVKLLSDLIETARWSRGKDVEPVLANMVNLSDADLRHAVVEAIGWRLRERGGPGGPVFEGGRRPEHETQFLAAEGLAKAGRPEGLNVLLTSIDFLTDDNQRERAILALGDLADPRALDTLLKHANDPESPLKDAAAEALGHMGRSDKAAEIFKLLERFARSSESVADNALKGLRWFNTHDAWLLIRQRAADTSFGRRGTAVEMLGYNNDPGTRDLLLKLLSTDENVYQVVNNAKTSARRLWGEDSLEPDYAILQNKHVSGQHAGDSLKRVSEKGDSGRILEILPNANPSHKEELSRTVINRPELPVEAAKKALAGNDAGTVRLAAQIVGRVGPKAGDAEKSLETALDKWSKAWEVKRTKLTRDGDEDDYEEDEDTGESHDRIT